MGSGGVGWNPAKGALQYTVVVVVVEANFPPSLS